MKGFSLIELMVVIAIVGLLAAVATPSYTDYVNRAQLSKIYSTMDYIKKQAIIYNSINGTWPQSGGSYNGGWDPDVFNHISDAGDSQCYYLEILINQNNFRNEDQYLMYGVLIQNVDGIAKTYCACETDPAGWEACSAKSGILKQLDCGNLIGSQPNNCTGVVLPL